MNSKINWLVTHTSAGSLVLQPWLTENGISYSLAQRYTKSGWLKKLSAGVYYRPGATEEVKPDWVDAIQAIDQQLHLPVHLAGLSSLNHQGLSHYLPLTEERVWVGSKNRQSLPKWFREFPEQNWFYSGSHKVPLLTERDFKTITIKGKELKASCPELAAYEVIDAVGKQISFEHAAELFQGLVNLSPRKVQSILERSSSVQTNRVFLFLSHYHGHQWAKHLDETAIQLGSGKRQIVENGQFDQRYQITVPKGLSIKESHYYDGEGS
ncbi:type IV toxin-antitoxin system AbiEi family antitoxin [Vibrio sp. SCSIO 43137]|uniref:type IV toxin-antitoxin system AbiEi family antitoxin n=1 Tax=Vibrio sp. SCSIO 43137 TaxID=3021011 RepID=UPI00230779AE|nr:type IV toxin-antitoxin system AbiEi family antitoxin [Vibrio sp. SCSIO 43137]WCE30780.1 type IV toxin-antitoxin system AbiEi family antitoxin [Vibrio sp. SCSIO 43137]